jgi:hypothetical protein
MAIGINPQTKNNRGADNPFVGPHLVGLAPHLLLQKHNKNIIEGVQPRPHIGICN